MALLSKSKYLIGLQCPRHLWISINAKERLPEIDEATQKKFDIGHELEEYAKKLFPGGIDLPTEDFTGNLQLTQASLKEEKPLFEPAFMIDDLYSRADILLPNKDGWDIIEVKSATKVKDINIHDVSFQKHVYEKCGLKIKKCYLMHINNEYIRKGEINPKELLTKTDITEEVEEAIKGISERIENMKEIISDPILPENKIGTHCNDPYDCPLIDECWSFLPEGHVFQLYGSRKKGFELIENKIYALKDIPSEFELNEKQELQVKCEKEGKVHIHKESIKQFLSTLQYPLYYLDFETINPAIPMFDNSKPYQQIPFQFSLHVVSKDGDVKHHEFLYSGTGDPRVDFSLELKKVIGDAGSVVVYSQSFEISRLKELVNFDSTCKDWVENVLSRIVDLLVPFRNFSYYNPLQKGSASLKSVLPALCGADYSSLEICKGDDASLLYLNSNYLGIGDKEKIRKDLLEYCKLDTLAMVWIVEKLGELI
jgi:hypothetical protein